MMTNTKKARKLTPAQLRELARHAGVTSGYKYNPRSATTRQILLDRGLLREVPLPFDYPHSSWPGGPDVGRPLFQGSMDWTTLVTEAGLEALKAAGVL